MIHVSRRSKKGEEECDYVTLIEDSVLLGCYCAGIVGGQ